VPEAAPQRTGLCADIAQVRAVEALGQLDDGLVVNLARLCNGRCVNLENLQPRLLVGQGDFWVVYKKEGVGW
jgi:hypothetical protein